MQVKGQLANNNVVDSRSLENQNWMGNVVGMAQHLSTYPSYMHSEVSSQSSIDSVGSDISSSSMQQGLMHTSMDNIDSYHQPACNKKRNMSNNDLGELQALALRMMKN